MRASAITDLLQQRIARYRDNLEHWRWTIRLADPREQRKKWYALIQSDRGEFLGKAAIEGLKEGDILKVSIYDYIVDVWVQSVHTIHTTTEPSE